MCNVDEGYAVRWTECRVVPLAPRHASTLSQQHVRLKCKLCLDLCPFPSTCAHVGLQTFACTTNSEMTVPPADPSESPRVCPPEFELTPVTQLLNNFLTRVHSVRRLVLQRRSQPVRALMGRDVEAVIEPASSTPN